MVLTLQKQTRGEINVTFIRALATAVTESCIEGKVFASRLNELEFDCMKYLAYWCTLRFQLTPAFIGLDGRKECNIESAEL